MTERFGIELKLASLSDSIDWPTPSPDLTGRVVAAIEVAPTTPFWTLSWAWRRRLAVAFGVVLVVLAVMAVSPSARQAAADLLGAAGIRIGFTSEEVTTVGADLELGQPTGLDDIRSAVDFVPRAPGGDVPGPPDAVYLTGDGQVTMAWAGGEPLPAAGGTGVALLFSQRAAYGFQDFAEKIVGPSTLVVGVEVEGQPGFWIEGTPHILTLLDRDGNRVEETNRLAANVLLWEVGGVNHRLETTGDLESSIAFVDRLEAMP